jgi:hypothetical protein
MQPRKVTFFALFLTSKIIIMFIRILVHGYKHDSATGFVLFCLLPLVIWLPQNFCQGYWSWCVSLHFFCFCYIEASLGSRGRGEY